MAKETKEEKEVKEFEAQVEAKRIELESKYETKVFSYSLFKVANSDISKVAGYFKAPNRQIAMSALDKATTLGYSAAGELIIQTCLLEESDPRLTADSYEFMPLYNGLLLAANGLVGVVNGNLKKN